MRAIGLVISLALIVPFFAYGTPASDTQTCADFIKSVKGAYPQEQQNTAPNTAIRVIPANTPPEKAPQLGHKETHDQIFVNADGSIMVTSGCGEEGKLGTILICTFDKNDKKTCGVKIPKDKQDVVDSVASALQKGSGQDVQKSLNDLAEAAKNQSASASALPALNRRQVLDAFKKAGVPNPEEALKQLGDLGYSKEAEELLRAAAAGDDQKVQKILQEVEQYRSSLPENLRRFSTNKFLDALDEKRKAAQVTDNTSEYFSALRTPSYTGFSNDETSSLGSDTPTGPSLVSQLAGQPIPVGPGGKVDPTSFYAHAVEAARMNGLDGYVDPRLHSLGLINTGSAEEWGRLYTMMAKQESDFSIYSSNPGECSYGILQFCPGEYGLGSMSDVRNPESSLQAVINVTRQGKLFQYFGPLKRELAGGNEVGKHAAWFDRTVSPQVNGEVPYSPIISGRGNYWSGVSSRRSESWTSPGTYNGNSGYNGSDGSISSLGNLFSGFSGGPSSVAPPTSIAPTGSAPSTNQPPSSNPPPSTTQAAIIHPVIAFTGAKEIDKGDSLLVAWAATGVSTTQTCILRHDDDAIAQGNSGTFFIPISAAYPDDSITFVLECALLDSRADRNEAEKELKVLVR